MGDYRCYICDKEFWRVKSLEKHLKNKECHAMEVDMDSPDGKKRSEFIFNLVDLLIKQNKILMEGNMTHNETKEIWKYRIERIDKGNNNE